MFIYNLFNRKPNNMWLFSFFISDFYMLLALLYYLISNWMDLWSYPVSRLLAIILAAAWTYLGPVMIIRWMNGYNDFCDKIDKIPGSNGCAGISKQCELQKNRWRNIAIDVIWVVLVVTILILPIGEKVLRQYYFHGYSDPNYWIFIICIAYIAYQTSWFFNFLVISWRTVKTIINNSAVTRHMLLSDGKSDGLSLIGGLISRTCVYFGSGLLFFPILIEFFISSGTIQSNKNTTALVFFLMAVYIFAIILYSIAIGKCVLEKSQVEKDIVLDELYSEKNGLRDKFDCYFTEEKIRYISGISVNPFASDVCLKFMYGILMSAFFPAVFSVLLGNGF